MALSPGTWVVEDADALLVQRYLAGDASAYDALVEKYRPQVSGLAFRLLGWRDDVDDVVQEVFLAALRGLPRFRGRSGVGTWLTAITVNKCRSHRRRRWIGWLRLGGARTESMQSCPDGRTHPAADQPAIDRERFERVRAAIERLPSRDREVIVLRYLEQLSVEEIAGVLSIRPQATQVRLHRARARLKEHLQDMVEE